jgi:hypothetical protein
MSKRDMSAQRAEESSRQSLQIMQPAGLNHSSQRTRNHSGTDAASAETAPTDRVTCVADHAAAIGGPAIRRPRSEHTNFGPTCRRSGQRCSRAETSTQMPDRFSSFSSAPSAHSPNMSIESSAARSSKESMRRCKLAQLRAPRPHLGRSQANQSKAVLCSRAATVMIFYLRPRPQGGRVMRVRPMS